VTTHGFAVNVENDLQPFEWIVPCGIEGVRMTSVCRELGREYDLDEAMNVVAGAYGEAFDREPVEISAARGRRLLAGELPEVAESPSA
jgi:lipoyl(octanoyl) transferase